MSDKVGSIHYDLGLNTKEFDKKSKETVEKLKKTAKRIALIGGAIAGAFAVTAVKSASDLVETLNKVDVAFGKNSKEVKEWSKKTIDSYGMAGSTAMETASLFGDMGTSMGQSTEEASKMSMSLTGLAGDLASFKNIDVEQATTALAGVFTGETESLKRLGIVMTQTQLEEYAMTKGIKKSYKEMSQAEKVALRYGYVMDSTKNAQGDFARTSDGTANQMRITGERFKELQEQIGLKLLPVANKLLQWAQDLISNKRLIGFIDDVKASFERWLPKLQAVATQVKDYLLPKLENLWTKLNEKLIPALTNLWKGVIEPLVPVIGTVLVGAIGLLIDAFSFIVDKIDILMPALVGLGVLLLGAQVLGAFTTVTTAITGASGLIAGLKALSATVSSSAFLNPWLLFSAVAIGALVAVRSSAEKTKSALDDLAGIGEDASNKLAQAKKDFDEGKITAEEYKKIAKEASEQANTASQSARDARESMEESIVGRFLKAGSFLKNFAGMRAMGGDVSANKSYIVGEQGPEMFVPNRAGSIIPHDSTQKLMSHNTSTSIYGNITIGSRTDADYFFRQLSRNEELASKGLASRAGTV